MQPATTTRTRRDGCGFVIVTSVFTCLFLVLNGVVLTASYDFLAEYGPRMMQRDKVKQLLLFIGPVGMIFVEWTVIDLIGRKLFGGRRQ